MVSSSVSTGLVMTIFGFYIALGVILGLVGSAFVPSTDITTPTDGPTITGIGDAIGIFFEGLSYSIEGLPGWANLLLFGPLAMTMFYILTVLILDLIPG